MLEHFYKEALLEKPVLGIRDRRVLNGLLLICVLGFFLRLINLGGPGLWFDEFMSAFRAHSAFKDTIADLSGSPLPPLYYLIMKVWVRLFGESAFSLRFPSLIFSTLSIPLIFLLARELFDKKVGLISALLLSVSPYSINYAQDAKMYSLFWALGILSFLFFYRFGKERRKKDLVAYTVTAVIALYTSYFAFFFIAAQNILIFMFFRPKELKQWLMAQLTIAFCFLPWIALIQSSVRIILFQVAWIPKEYSYPGFLASLFMQISGVNLKQELPIAYMRQPDFYIYLFLIVSFLAGFVKMASGRKGPGFTKPCILLLGWIAIPILIHWLVNYSYAHWCITRYLGFMHIPFLIILGKGLSGYRARVAVIVLSVLLAIILLMRLTPYYRFGQKIETAQFKELSGFLTKNASGNSLVLCLDGWAKAMVYLVGYYEKNCDLQFLDGRQSEEKRFYLPPGTRGCHLRFLDARRAADWGFIKSYNPIFVYCLKDKERTVSIDGYAFKGEYYWEKWKILWFTKIPGGDKDKYFFHSTPLY